MSIGKLWRSSKEVLLSAILLLVMALPATGSMAGDPDDPASLIRTAQRLSLEGRYAEAATAWEDIADSFHPRSRQERKSRGFPIAVHTVAALNWLLAGEYDRFQASVDRLWDLGNDWDHRRMSADHYALRALADRVAGRGVSVSPSALPEKLRGILKKQLTSEPADRPAIETR